MAFGGATAPTGWLVCDGSSVLRASYPDLFAAIGTTWGSVDGTHFNVPDLRGMFLRGTGTNATGSSSGAVGPSVGSYSADAFQGHWHGINDPGHTHSYSTFGAAGSLTYTSGAYAAYVASTGAATTNVTVRDPSTDGVNGTPRTSTETKPKNYGVLYIIKT